MDGATTLGTGSLNASGVATYATTNLATGAHSITAQYGGDSNFSGSTSAAVAVTVQAAVPPSFSISASPTSLSIAPGQTGAATITVTPAGGFVQPVTFACSGLPSEASCSFAPPSLTPAGSPIPTTLTVSTTAPTPSLAHSGVYRTGLAGLLALASLLLLGMPGASRVARGSYGCVLLLVALGVAMIGCGGGSSGTGGGGSGTTSDPGTPAGTSTVTITATAGATKETATLQLTVQ